MEEEEPKTIFSSSSQATWLDLPQPLTELILERLPLSDYLRFSAVCRKWRSIQRNHRLRRGPVLSLPWLCHFPKPFPPDRKPHSDPEPVVCYSPFEDRFHHFPAPDAALISPSLSQCVIGSSEGWLILNFTRTFPSRRSLFISLRTVYYSLLNPISGEHLQLPPLTMKENDDVLVASLTSPPTDPDCVFMVPAQSHVFLCRVGDPDWTKLSQPPHQPIAASKDYPFGNLVNTAVFYKGGFYNMCFDNSLFIVDPALPTPSIQLLDMGWSHPPFPGSSSSAFRFDYLVESNGDLLVALLVFARDDGPIQGVQVFKADFIGKMWVGVESLGDHVLFLGTNCSFSLLAANVGGTKNYIYYNINYQKRRDFKTQGRPHTWTAFDFGSGTVIHGPPFPDTYLHGYDPWWLPINCSWILPSVAYVNPAEDNSDPLHTAASEAFAGDMNDILAPIEVSDTSGSEKGIQKPS